MLSSLTSNKGFSLVEFMVAMVLSLAAMATASSIFLAGFAIDNKSIKFSRLADEVASISALLSEDIKRAGYVNNAEILVSTATAAGNTSRCVGTADGCSNLAFRTLTISEFGGEAADSCITFAYDIDDDTNYTSDDAMGYRLHDNAIDTRKGLNECADGNWEQLTDPDFVTISDLSFIACGQDDNTAALCAAFSYPPVAPALPAPQIIRNDVYRLSFSFTATLVSDNSVSLTATETVVVRNASYN